MNKLIVRIIIAVVFSSIVAGTGVQGNAIVLQTLFTVLGIVFSISMSLLVSFNLSKVLNKDLRLSLRGSIVHVRDALVLDFGISTLGLFVALIWKGELRYELTNWLVVDVMLVAVCLVAASLLYEMCNFKMLHKLHCDIEDAVIEEESKKKVK